MGILFANTPNGIWAFAILTVILGGLTAWATGKAVAKTWRPFPQVVVYMLVLAAFVQFLHFALFQEDLLSIQFFLTTYVILLIASAMGFRRMRTRQMVTQYSFAFEPAGAFAWRLKTGKA